MPSTSSTLVVTWNNREFLGRCLESLPKDSEIIVVDNASTDGSPDFVAETFPHVRLIRLESNIGFGAAVNRAAAEATGTYLLLLNPDAEATPKSIERLMEFLDEHITCGAAAGRLLSMTEDWQRGFNVRRLPTYGTVTADLWLFKHVWPSNPADPEGRGGRHHRRHVAGRGTAGRGLPDGAPARLRTDRRDGRALLPGLVRRRRPLPADSRGGVDHLLRATLQFPPRRRRVGRRRSACRG